MIYISAGHHLKDSGAVSGKWIERDLAIEFRDLVCQNLSKKGYKFIKDSDLETLPQYLARIQPGNGSVVVEIHWNASVNPTATGVEVLIADAHNQISKDLAKDLSMLISNTLGLFNRGVKTERQSARGKLGFVRKAGATALVEMCFISNQFDMKAYQDKKVQLAELFALMLIKYEDKVK